MTDTTTRRISKLAHALGTLVFVLALAFTFPAVAERVPRSLAVGVALFLITGAGVLVLTYLALFAAGALDEPVSLGRFVPDAWESILASTAMVAISWISLARLIDGTSSGLRFVAPALLVTAVGLTIHRAWRLRIRRPPGSAQADPHLP